MKKLICLFALSSVGFAVKSAYGTEVPAEKMQAIYNEVATPVKHGLILSPEKGEMIDDPMVYRHGDAWYMIFIRFDGKGYDTWLAKSDDLIHWTKLGCIFKRGEKGEWDQAQADGWPALVDTRWEGPNTLNTFQGKYWMMYLGGALNGYETDPLSTGVAWTDDPSAVKPWTRYSANPVMRPSDSDARTFEKKTIFKHFTVEDPSRSCGGRFVNFYNAKPQGVWQENIGMAVSDDMLHWKRVGTNPIIEDCPAGKHGISGNPMIKRIGDVWVMFYFGYRWKDGVTGAFDTFACSYDLRNWTKWTGEPLIRPTPGTCDATHAHKPCVLKHNGVVYHFYCAVAGKMRGIALATSRPLSVNDARKQKTKLPRVWMSTQWREPFEETVRMCAAQGVDCVEVPTWDTNVCVKGLTALRKYGLKGFTSSGFDTSEDSRGLETNGRNFERGVFTGGSFRGHAIDRTLFKFEAKVHDIIIEPPVYSSVQCYSKRVKNTDGKAVTVRSGHYFGDGTSFEPTGLAEVIVPERLFDGKPHVKIIQCEVLPADSNAIVEGDTVTKEMSGPEITDRRLVRLRFDLSSCTNYLLDKVGIAVYWHNSLTGSGWKSGHGQLSVFSKHTRDAAEHSGWWRLNQWKKVNGGIFPDEIVAIRFGDECFNITGHMNHRACSFPLWGFCESGRADFTKASPALVQPRVWGYPEIYGVEAYGMAMYRYHLACAELVRAFVKGARSVAPHVKVFRNTTRGGVWDESNDHDGSGQELLTRELDFVHIDPYPVGNKYYQETIPFDMGYMSALARRYGKPLVPWLQAHSYRPCGLKSVTPADLDRMVAQHDCFDCDAIMWLGFDLKPGNSDTEMTFPYGNPESWDHVKTIHSQFASKKNARRKNVQLAVLRPYSVRAICCSQGAQWESWRNPADRLLAEYVRAWSVDHGLAYDVFEIPPCETFAEKAAREKELQKYPYIVSSLPYPRARVIGAETQGTVMSAEEVKGFRKKFSEEISRIVNQ